MHRFRRLFTALPTSPATRHIKFHILIFIFRLIWYVKTPTFEWRHDDVTINDVWTKSQFAHFNRRPDISELVEEIICPRECDHMCIESNYGPVCACREGFRLYDDLRTCVLTEGKYLSLSTSFSSTWRKIKSGTQCPFLEAMVWVAPRACSEYQFYWALRNWLTNPTYFCMQRVIA